jgi:hypothetical protein
MMSDKIAKTIKINKLNNDYRMKFEIKLSNEFKIRLKIATMLIKVAGFVLGCGIDISTTDKAFKVGE